MKYKEGDVVRIQSKDWFIAQEKIEYGNICPPTEYTSFFVNYMCRYCGKTATIKKVDDKNKIYKLDIDYQEWDWEDWMFDPSYL
jgi:hypothetical protein